MVGDPPKELDQNLLLEEIRKEVRIQEEKESSVCHLPEIHYPICCTDSVQGFLQRLAEFIIGKKTSTIQLFPDEELEEQLEMAKEESASIE